MQELSDLENADLSDFKMPPVILFLSKLGMDFIYSPNYCPDFRRYVVPVIWKPKGLPPDIKKVYPRAKLRL